MTNLALTGFMGVGKSTVGRYVAGALHFKYVDTDEAIEERSSRRIQEIFATDGEPRFREMERALMLETLDWKKTVIATGGGLVAYFDNLELLKRTAFVVCLYASAQTIYRRIKRHNHRPLLNTGDPLATISGLLRKRDASYRHADLMINTETRPLRTVAQLIIRQFREAAGTACRPGREALPPRSKG